MFGLFVFCFICGLICSFISGFKARNSFGFFLLGALLGPLGIVLALVFPANERELEQQKIKYGDYKKCPHCAELIREEASKCRYCGSFVEVDLAKDVSLIEAEKMEYRKACGESGWMAIKIFSLVILIIVSLMASALLIK